MSSRETWVWEGYLHRVGDIGKWVSTEEEDRSGHSAPLFPARTGCVDLTITNLLEGAVAFMPEDVTEGSQSLPAASAPKVRHRSSQGQDLRAGLGSLCAPSP